MITGVSKIPAVDGQSLNYCSIEFFDFHPPLPLESQGVCI